MACMIGAFVCGIVGAAAADEKDDFCMSASVFVFVMLVFGAWMARCV